MGESLEVRARLALDGDPRSAGRARRFIRDFCSVAELGEEVCDLAALLTSELVTNALRYGGSSALLEARRPGSVLRVAVHDANPALPEEGLSPPVTAESGRGIMLVSSLAARWGVEPDPHGGKAVWFELDLG